MAYVGSVIAGILGLIVGSFLNVVILRLNTRKGLGGRSECFSCQATLRWSELIPVISFLIQRGRCRSCGARIRWQYMLVELATAFVFATIVFKYATGPFITLEGIVSAVILCIIFSVGIVISVYDLRHFIVPDPLVYGLIISSGLLLFFSDTAPFFVRFFFQTPEPYRMLMGVLLPLPFACAWYFSRGRLMGFGDIKIMVTMGWLLGVWGGITAVVLAFWIALGWIMSVYIFQHVASLFLRLKHFIMKTRYRPLQYVRLYRSTQVPFAPFLFIALYIVIVWQVKFFPFL